MCMEDVTSVTHLVCTLMWKEPVSLSFDQDPGHRTDLAGTGQRLSLGGEHRYVFHVCVHPSVWR